MLTVSLTEQPQWGWGLTASLKKTNKKLRIEEIVEFEPNIFQQQHSSQT